MRAVRSAGTPRRAAARRTFPRPTARPWHRRWAVPRTREQPSAGARAVRGTQGHACGNARSRRPARSAPQGPAASRCRRNRLAETGRPRPRHVPRPPAFLTHRLRGAQKLRSAPQQHRGSRRSAALHRRAQYSEDSAALPARSTAVREDRAGDRPHAPPGGQPPVRRLGTHPPSARRRTARYAGQGTARRARSQTGRNEGQVPLAAPSEAAARQPNPRPGRNRHGAS